MKYIGLMARVQWKFFFLGPDKTPMMLLESGLLPLLSSCGWRVDQVPIINYEEAANHENFVYDEPGKHLRAKNCLEVGTVCRNIKEQVLAHALRKKFVLIIGGDHCISIGSIPALLTARANTGIIWVDAHADLNTPLTSNSGNMHGMPLGVDVYHLVPISKLN